MILGTLACPSVQLSITFRTSLSCATVVQSLHSTLSIAPPYSCLPRGAIISFMPLTWQQQTHKYRRKQSPMNICLLFYILPLYHTLSSPVQRVVEDFSTIKMSLATLSGLFPKLCSIITSSLWIKDDTNTAC